MRQPYSLCSHPQRAPGLLSLRAEVHYCITEKLGVTDERGASWDVDGSPASPYHRRTRLLPMPG